MSTSDVIELMMLLVEVIIAVIAIIQFFDNRYDK